MMVGAASTASPARIEQTFLSFDFGTRRIGVAGGNCISRTATPLTTLVAGDFDAIAALIHEWQPDALVVGVPFHPDGAEHEVTVKARRFARQLAGRYRLPVHEVDERYSSAAVSDARDVDAAAAAVILEQYLGGLR